MILCVAEFVLLPQDDLMDFMDFMEKVRNLPTHGKNLVSFDVDFQLINPLLEAVVYFLERKLSSSDVTEFRYAYIFCLANKLFEFRLFY